MRLYYVLTTWQNDSRTDLEGPWVDEDEARDRAAIPTGGCEVDPSYRRVLEIDAPVIARCYHGPWSR